MVKELYFVWWWCGCVRFSVEWPGNEIWSWWRMWTKSALVFFEEAAFLCLFFSNFKIWLFLISSNVFWICQHQLPLWVMYSWAHLTCIFFFLFSKKNKTKTKKTFIKTKCFSFFHNYSLRYFDQTKISKKHWKCFEYQSDHSPMWLKQC